MQKTVDIHLKPEARERYGLPDIPYPIAIRDLASLGAGGNLPLARMLHCLQLRSRDGGAEWMQLEPAMNRLAELLAPDDDHDVITAAGDTWWLEVGPVDLDTKIVTVQRGDHLIAALNPTEDGRLRVAVYRPLDADSAERLIALGRTPHPEHGVCMRDNNWEYALDASAGMGNFYAFTAGHAHLSYWKNGIGINGDGTEDPEWRKKRALTPRTAAPVIAELGVWYSMAGGDGTTNHHL